MHDVVHQDMPQDTVICAIKTCREANESCDARRRASLDSFPSAIKICRLWRVPYVISFHMTACLDSTVTCGIKTCRKTLSHVLSRHAVCHLTRSPVLSRYAVCDMCRMSTNSKTCLTSHDIRYLLHVTHQFMT